MQVAPQVVAPTDWRASAEAMRDWRLDLLTAIDRRDSIEVIAHYVRDGEHAWCTTSIPHDGSLDSIADVHPAAAWPERETSEMFGVRIGEGARLLRHDDDIRPPLRKATPLPARVQTPWPGAAEPGDDGRQGANPSRRRTRPPGVHPEWET
jgi:NADH:ubiquinone oxidoreductase subunit C